jgi:hypothetical protein
VRQRLASSCAPSARGRGGGAVHARCVHRGAGGSKWQKPADDVAHPEEEVAAATPPRTRTRLGLLFLAARPRRRPLSTARVRTTIAQ